jgi:hypothetical protein
MSLAGMKIVHTIPGRVRLKIPQLKNNPDLAGDIRQRVSGIRGIRRIEAYPLTGGLVVLYDLGQLPSLESLLALSETFTGLSSEIDLGQIEMWMAASGIGAGDPSSLAESISTALESLNTGVGKITGGLDLKLPLPLVPFVLGRRGLLIVEKAPFPRLVRSPLVLLSAASSC